eukprot:scaffold32325_cov26-Tisochrysis_lutea.AAC.5
MEAAHTHQNSSAPPGDRLSTQAANASSSSLGGAGRHRATRTVWRVPHVSPSSSNKETMSSWLLGNALSTSAGRHAPEYSSSKSRTCVRLTPAVQVHRRAVGGRWRACKARAVCPRAGAWQLKCSLPCTHTSTAIPQRKCCTRMSSASESSAASSSASA